MVLTGVVIALLSYAHSRDKTGRRLNIRLICVLLSMMGSWGGFILALLIPEYLLTYLPIYTFSMLSVPICLYVYIRFYVRIGKPEDSLTLKFLRFIFPFVTAICTAFFPRWSEAVRTASGISGISWLSLAVSVLYVTLTMRIIWQHYKERRRDEGMTLVLTRRFTWLMVLQLINIIVMVYRNFYGNTQTSIPAIILSALFFSIITGMLLHHVLCRDFLLFHKKVTRKANITPPVENKAERSVEKKTGNKTKAASAKPFSPAGPEGLSRKKFEQYFFKYKVYLNPDLNITGLAEQLATNRTYLSSFINKEYGMNFSRYVNSIRLKELERLMSLPANEGTSIRKLAEKAGFGTYGGYLKARKNVLGKEESE